MSVTSEKCFAESTAKHRRGQFNWYAKPTLQDRRCSVSLGRLPSSHGSRANFSPKAFRATS